MFDNSLPNVHGAPVIARNTLFNETTSDLQRGNTDLVLMASSSLSASTAIAVTNFNGRGIFAYMNITSAFPGSASTTWALKLKAIQPNATASAVTLAACFPASASGAYVLCVYPGASKATASGSTSAQANLAVASLPVPRNFQIVASLSTGATSKEVVMSLGLTIIN
jgi:hypothetical protein